MAPEDRDIWGATSAGVGEMVLAALDLGAHRIVIGLGGSATNDGGSG
ncbi:MAG: glycerate kinase, partial [Acidipropionibacterium jensenii]|nr:glycerate kinase [Acidipropionibacterium jensenii]